MSARTRLPRKAASTPTYVYDNPTDEEEQANESGTDEDEVGSKRSKGKGKAAPKRRKIAVEESDLEEEEESGEEDDDDDEASNEEGKGGKEKEIEYDVPRVDFSKVLPYEIIVEIFSYLHPYSLYGFSILNKSFRSILMNESSKNLWRKALNVTALPKLDDEEVHPAKLCGLLLDKNCQFCGKDNPLAADAHLLLRLCKDCRIQNWVSVADIGPGKKYSDFHPATLLCVPTTNYSAEYANGAYRQRTYVLYGDLQETSETLENLQIQDEVEADSPFADDSGPDARKVQKSLSKARKLKRRSWYSNGYEARAMELENGLVEEYSGRVKEYIVLKVEGKKEKKELAEWLLLNAQHLRRSREIDETVAKAQESQAAELRRGALEDRVLADGVFSNRSYFHTSEWRGSQFVKLSAPITDQGWNELKVPIYRLLGNIAASAIYARFSKKGNDDSDDEGGRPRLPKRPKAVSAQAWKYVLPEIRKVAKARRAPVEEVKPVQIAPSPAPTTAKSLRKQRPVFGWEQTQAKSAFFRPRYDKLIKADGGERIKTALPSFQSYFELETIQSLYDQPEFGVSAETAEEDTAQYVDLLDDILEEIDALQQEYRIEALKLILRATTEMTDKEIDNLDPDVLADEYNDDFFLRPSSWLCCAGCGNIGSLNDVLACQTHWRCAHNGKALPFDLPLEVAVAWSAVLELANVDADDSSVTAADLDAAFKERWLVWDNAPKYKGGKKEWKELICKVHDVAQQYDRGDIALAAPVIVMKKRGKSRRRMRARWWW